MYRAPELLHRYAPTKAADVWSMGVTALEVFTAIQNINDDTLLHVAAYLGRTDIVKLVNNCLLNTADLYRLMRIQNRDGNTPLGCGLVEENTETVKVILNCFPASDMSKVISIPSNNGNTVLSLVAQYGPMDLVKLCVDIIPPEELYAQLLVTDDDGDTVIHCAAYGNQSEAAVYLLDKLTENKLEKYLK
ncbi:hypothetical protein EB796_013029 [Bugula neritina]|uniref:Uncharacterized protein n=1 Tax=Bugula neritina TaxID=10212 RepID=A0A7J7JQM3_BUGNE|nr:hypothetical protein EB796_013029 [Bugula neritina]